MSQVKDRVYDDEQTINPNTGQHDNIGITAAEQTEFDRITSQTGSNPGSSTASGQRSETSGRGSTSSSVGQRITNRFGGQSGQETGMAAGAASSAVAGGGAIGKIKGLIGNRKSGAGAGIGAESEAKGNGTKKAAMVGLALAGCIIAIVMFLMNFLQIPGIVAGIAGQRLAAVTRETVNSNSKTVAQKIALDSVSDETYKSITGRYRSAGNQLMEKVNSFRPQKVLQNLVAGGKLELVYSEPSGIGGRQRLQSMIVDGKTFPMDAAADVNRVTHPVEYMKAVYDQKRQFKMALHEALRGRNFYTRYKTTKAARAKIKVKMWAWSKDDLKKFRNASAERIDLENARISNERATNKGESTAKAKAGSSSSDVNKAIEPVAEDIAKCVADDSCLKETINSSRAGNGSVPSTTQEILTKAFTSEALEKVMAGLNPVYMIGVPLCLIYDGSIINSGGTIDANSEQAQRIFHQLAASASQQQAGGNNVTGEALGGIIRQMGNTPGQSNSERRANGVDVDTLDNTTPTQASTGGTFSADIFDTFLPAGVASAFSAIAEPSCKVLTSPWTLVGVLAVTIIPGVGEAMQAGGQVTARAIGALIAKQMAQVLRGFFTKKNLTQFGTITGMTIAATLVAKFMVLQHTGAGSNGVQQGEEYLNVADMGADQTGSEVERVGQFGAPLTNTEANKLKPLNVAFMDSEKQLQTPYQRYLAVTNPGSLTNQIVLKIGNTLNLHGAQSMMSSSASLLNPVKLFSMATSPFHKYATVKAQSASSIDKSSYGNVQWYWSEEEENNFLNNPIYDMFPNQEALDQSGKEAEINEKYARCFTDSMGTLLSGNGGEPAIYRDETGNVIPDKGLCSPNNLGMKNPDYGDLVYRWRVAKRYLATLDNLTDAQTLTAK